MHDVENIGYDVENATNPRAYARPRTPIRHGQPPIRSRMRARGHQSAPGHDVEKSGHDVENATNPRAYARPRTPIRPGQPLIRAVLEIYIMI